MWPNFTNNHFRSDIRGSPYNQPYIYVFLGFTAGIVVFEGCLRWTFVQ